MSRLRAGAGSEPAPAKQKECLGLKSQARRLRATGREPGRREVPASDRGARREGLAPQPGSA